MSFSLGAGPEVEASPAAAAVAAAADAMTGGGVVGLTNEEGGGRGRRVRADVMFGSDLCTCH
jgi:hypothetical protein